MKSNYCSPLHLHKCNWYLYTIHYWWALKFYSLVVSHYRYKLVQEDLHQLKFLKTFLGITLYESGIKQLKKKCWSDPAVASGVRNYGCVSRRVVTSIIEKLRFSVFNNITKVDFQVVFIWIW